MPAPGVHRRPRNMRVSKICDGGVQNFDAVSTGCAVRTENLMTSACEVWLTTCFFLNHPGSRIVTEEHAIKHCRSQSSRYAGRTCPSHPNAAYVADKR